jgi:hypothetical protein
MNIYMMLLLVCCCIFGFLVHRCMFMFMDPQPNLKSGCHSKTSACFVYKIKQYNNAETFFDSQKG